MELSLEPDAAPKGSTRRRAFAWGFIAGFVAALLLLLAGLLGAAAFLRTDMAARKAERLKPPPLTEGTAADYSITVVGADGAQQSGEAFRGQPLFLHFWNPECLSCEAEIPALNALYAQISGEGIGFLAIATDTEPSALADEAARLGIQYPIYTLAGDLPAVFRFTAGPATFIVNAAGTLVFKHVGAARWDDASAVLYLKSLAAAEHPAP